jgi:hypothetical protein
MMKRKISVSLKVRLRVARKTSALPKEVGLHCTHLSKQSEMTIDLDIYCCNFGFCSVIKYCLGANKCCSKSNKLKCACRTQKRNEPRRVELPPASEPTATTISVQKAEIVTPSVAQSQYGQCDYYKCSPLASKARFCRPYNPDN